MVKFSIKPKLLRCGVWKPYTYISHDSRNVLLKNLRETFLNLYCDILNIPYKIDKETMQKVKDNL